jgi:6-phosphogluconolactonase
MSAQLHAFNSGAELAEQLATEVASRLSAAIGERGTASLAVSGGSTPKLFFQVLSSKDIAWSKVNLTLVDERFVEADNPRSNHLLVAENLLQNKAAVANFVPLYHEASSIQDAAIIATQKTAAIGHPFDVVILGMGTDGHTASFFPGGDNLPTALDASAKPAVITMQAAGAGEERLTLNFSSLNDARFLVLHIEGDSKKQVLEKAQSAGDEQDMPIRAVLRRAATPVDIYWAP